MDVPHVSDRKKAGDAVRELCGANTWQLLVLPSSLLLTPHLGLNSVAFLVGGPESVQGDQIWDSVFLPRKSIVNNQ